MSSLHELAHAKINLYLHVTGRRQADGYHLLDSLAVFAGAADRLDLKTGSGQGGHVALDIKGRFSARLGDEDCTDNLIVRAGAILREQIGKDAARSLPDVEITLHKELPVASGIGGGSADAAAALRLLLGVWNLDLPRATLMALATRLGADVPVCLDQCAARMEGIGEELSPAPRLPPCGMMLVNCGQSVSTPQVFKARAPVFTPRATLPSTWATLADMVRDLATQTNDLQEAACAICPEIVTVLDALRTAPGCRLARMSGSGATCFALFDSPDAARAAQAAVQQAGAHWWVWAGDLCRSSADVRTSIPA
ncbi:4-(cytidine 5'-diphospho)-2-C-methyl-D-erythritol kinase [Komagataeibacter nataicola]|uniref:4-diphosphocytidyl-2-C-methyl-D-erythritol kinase n=1 Tax=Komagataeibacter nataicola TaxID=265960 RepID=A0A9N7H0J5_9PROT|nr:4-(cytidine 5'-diphospho)-2-C-methyl-D-erythritol kinase [Komagataeibacter nataicola]AQU87329.1 4-(cytidine 5'-diphospho)-2-C-methyl-D-erythritol kinase [Komagataeibacter nataicola]PYD67408.1 4-(cytidine 5'-diphospho)-2-C-methyl-D-erythritol kinase [Komagataeibacter nataicola]WEQ55720.1 4-(cytidine 5'-diphospho)-2-C-methyl-D-erythritol kinase [Komagataeibacter nataicola]GBR15125.1 4-diphosphocytidyl-2-C-methyl-D-erythritol kinase [Komagataeibacter nataicola NRIC 0616]